MTEWSLASAELTAAQVAAILKLAGRAGAADGVAPLSEPVLLHLRYDGSVPPTGAGAAPTGAGAGAAPETRLGRDFVATVDGEIAAYAHLAPPGPEVSGELVVDPGRRRQGIGRALVGELAAAANGHLLQLWAHGDLPAAASLARVAGLERFRTLWQLRRSLRDPVTRPEFPPGRRLRTFVPGQDEDEWLALNGRAFAKHPEQGGWTRHDLQLREREPWFDPAGFFIAERHGQMAGFHWTKVHPPGVGEVYVVGVDPVEQGSGLGRALTLAGLEHLRDLGLQEAMLYVDGDNTAAIRMYEALGFTRARTDVMYRRADR
ncbi:MAG: mycothiol synthase [Streptosporangiaceae bacterium]|jgi:mycothiol synthase